MQFIHIVANNGHNFRIEADYEANIIDLGNPEYLINIAWNQQVWPIN